MARIRTIKPEFPHSESVGNLSRDARLLFVLIWTIADDSGRLRGNSRMLASLLFPYDEDAKELIDGWLRELEREGCILRYTVDGQIYCQVLNWLKHQRIDKPTPSKFPEFQEGSRLFANIREDSENAPGRKGREGKGEEGRKTLSGKNLPDPIPPDSKDENKKALRAAALPILDILNQKAGRNYQPVPANVDLIVARLREGATPTQLKQVVVKKCREWKDDPKMADYLRPKTLFNATNFANYVGELVSSDGGNDDRLPGM